VRLSAKHTGRLGDSHSLLSDLYQTQIHTEFLRRFGHPVWEVSKLQETETRPSCLGRRALISAPLSGHYLTQTEITEASRQTRKSHDVQMRGD
jgi:hypothetical protein